MFGTPWQKELLHRLSAIQPVYVVGGAVRDALLGLPAKDLDVVIGALTAEQIHHILKEWGYAPHLLGKRYQTVSLFHEGERLDIAPMGETDLILDARRRDFTINAIFYECATGTWFDPLAGRKDLLERRLKAAHPASCFRQDPLRILRLIRIAAQYDLTIEEETWKEAAASLPLLKPVAAERVSAELVKLLCLAKAEQGLRDLGELGYWRLYLPELARLQGLEQNQYHSLDAWEHTLKVVSNIPPRPHLRLAALFHDVGKWGTAGRTCYLRGELQAQKNGFKIGAFQVKGKNVACCQGQWVEIYGVCLDQFPEIIHSKRCKRSLEKEEGFTWEAEGKRHFLRHEIESAVLTRNIFKRFRFGMFLDFPGQRGERELISLVKNHMNGTFVFMDQIKGERLNQLAAKIRRFVWKYAWTGRSFEPRRVEDFLQLWQADFLGGKQHTEQYGENLQMIQSQIRESCAQLGHRYDQMDWSLLKEFSAKKQLNGKQYGQFKYQVRERLMLHSDAENITLNYLESEYRLWQSKAAKNAYE
ncbi:MAG: CCA tRNA nucleotidyltransferase [Peptococcaceae bacterium]|jgi:poly(A) polymerase|nr:CCA tRNA nucleotidyltransferase [Peptococcaceae bacterium]